MLLIYRIINKIFNIIEVVKHKAYLQTCIASGLKLGRNTVIREKVNLGSEPFLVEIGDDTRVASGTTFINHSGGTANLRKIVGYETVRNFGRIKVGKNCAIGSGCVILQNVQIGDNCILGANSVLSESMPSNTVYGGNPAKYICEIEDYGDYLVKTTVDYPIELEKNRKELKNWLTKNLPEKFKSTK